MKPPNGRNPVPTFADPIGKYEVTFTASPSCEQIPPPLHRRTYYGTITGGGVIFEIRLTNPSFYDHYETFWLTTSRGSAKVWLESQYAANQWLEDLPIIERLDSGGYVAVQGTTNVLLDANIARASPCGRAHLRIVPALHGLAMASTHPPVPIFFRAWRTTM